MNYDPPDQFDEMSSQMPHIFLFGGDEPWRASDWTSSDDRVRGGSSHSYLDCRQSVSEFYGNLDIKTLGGAGFASQRTTGEDRNWDLSKYDGLELDIEKSDGKQYTIILKDELLPKSPNGREQSTVSWEYDFRVEGARNGDGKFFVAWDDLKPTYRGKEKTDSKPLDLENIKRISIMMRSFFGTQEGPFSLSLVSIAASKTPSSRPDSGVFTDPYHDADGQEEKSDNTSDNTAHKWFGWLFGSCAVS